MSDASGVVGAITYALFGAALFYLGSRALITSWLWRRYPRKLATFMDCSACAGFWYGAGLALVFRFPALSISGDAWYLPIVVGIFAIAWTPMVAGVLQAGLERVGVAAGVEISEDARDGE